MKVNEFRKDLKQAFDDALRGESVVIERGGVQFQLVADGVVPKITPRVEPNPVVSVKKPANIIPNTARMSGPVCKIHGLPLDDRGRCLQKGCKYS